MTAIIFEAETPQEPLPDPSTSHQQEWQDLLKRLDEPARMPTKSKRIYIDGLVRIITDSEIAIIKRNEHRLWTRSAARDDAEAAMVIAIQLNDQPSTAGES